MVVLIITIILMLVLHFLPKVHNRSIKLLKETCLLTIELEEAFEFLMKGKALKFVYSA